MPEVLGSSRKGAEEVEAKAEEAVRKARLWIDKSKCINCLGEIRMMCQKNTNFCCQRCEKVFYATHA